MIAALIMVAALVVLVPTKTSDAFQTGSAGFVSDDFNSSVLGAQWTFVDPVGNSSYALAGAGTGQATVAISVPAGTSHDPWGSTNRSARLMQPIANVDFDLEVGFASTPTQRYQMNGLIIEQDATNWIRFDAHHDGSQLRVFAARTLAGKSKSMLNVVAPANTSHLRLDRAGDVWTGFYSTDGTTWVNAGSFTFALATTSAGVFAANANPNPAYTAIIDYAFDTATPVVPEDGATYPVNVTIVGNGTVAKSPDQTSYSNGAVVQLTATPNAGETFIGWTGDITSTNPIIDVTIAGAPITVTAEFSVTPTYPVNVTIVGNGTVAKSPDQPAYPNGAVVQLTATPNAGETFIGWTGDITATNPIIDVTIAGAPITITAAFSNTPPPSGILLWYGNTQNFGNNGVTQRWVNILGTVTDPDGVGSLSYRLNGGPIQPLNVGPDLRRLYGAGDFNIEIDKANLLVGANSVLVVLNDELGETTEQVVTVNWNPSVLALPYTIDWATASGPTDGAQPVDGHWAINNGALRILETGYDRTIALGDLGWSDFEVTVPVTIHSLGPGSGTPESGQPLVGLGLRWLGHSVTNNQPNEGWFPTGAFAWYRPSNSGTKRIELTGNNGSPIARFTTGDLAFGTTYIFKARAVTQADGTRYYFKVWQQGQPEPGWQTEILEPDGPALGSILLIAHHYDVSFGNVVVTAVP